jgi:hypothetical protein
MQVQQALSAATIVAVWEHGRDKHPVDRALLMLAQAHPSMSPSALSTLTVGQRNRLLLDLRSKTLGPLANCFVKCVECDAPLEFTLDVTTLYTPDQDETPPSRSTLTIDDFLVSFRLPTSLDLVAIVGHTNAAEGRYRLIERCVLQAERGGKAIAAARLPETVMAALAGAMLECDEQAEIEIELGCGECDHSWSTLFDIGSFFWTELEAQAKRLLRDVDLLARAYGWHEAEILALSPVRRQFYLELVQR